MKKYCSNCVYGNKGQWVAATKHNERHRIVECTYEFPPLPVWALGRLTSCDRKIREWYRGRKETTCKTWEK